MKGDKIADFYKKEPVKAIANNLLLALTTAKTNDLPQLFKLLDSLILSIMPKKSIALVRNSIKTIFETQDARLMILLSHLYLEKCLEEIIKKKFERPKNILENNFKQKLDIIYSLGSIDEKSYHDISAINRIRNKFVHNLNYTFKIEDFNNFDELKKTLSIIKDRHKKARALILRYLLKIVLLMVQIDLYKNHKYLYLVNVTPE